MQVLEGHLGDVGHEVLQELEVELAVLVADFGEDRLGILDLILQCLDVFIMHLHKDLLHLLKVDGVLEALKLGIRHLQTGLALVEGLDHRIGKADGSQDQAALDQRATNLLFLREFDVAGILRDPEQEIRPLSLLLVHI